MTSSRKSRVPVTNTIASFPGSMFEAETVQWNVGGKVEWKVEESGVWRVERKSKVEGRAEWGEECGEW